MSKYSNKKKLLSFIVCMLFTIPGCSYFFEPKQYVSNIIGNMEDASTYFETRQLEISVENMEDKDCLQVITSSGEKYLYMDGANNGELLYKIEKQVGYEENEKEYEGTLTIRLIAANIDEGTADVLVDGDFGITGVTYYLPDFKEVVPDWGDYAEAQLKVERWASGEELSALYQQGKEIEQLLIEYSEECEYEGE